MTTFVRVQDILHLVMAVMVVTGVVIAIDQQSLLGAFLACLSAISVVNSFLCVRVVHLLEIDQRFDDTVIGTSTEP